MLTTYTCWGLLFVNGCKMHLLENDMYTATTFSIVNKMYVNKQKNWHVCCCHNPSAMTPSFEYGVKCTFLQTSRPSFDFECCFPSSLQAVQVFDLCMFGLCPPPGPQTNVSFTKSTRTHWHSRLGVKFSCCWNGEQGDISGRDAKHPLRFSPRFCMVMMDGRVFVWSFSLWWLICSKT